MKIVHVTDAYLPKQGGIEVQVHDLAQRQQACGHQVDVLTCAPPPGARAGWAWRAGRRVRSEAAAGPAAVTVHRTGTPWPRVPGSAAAVRSWILDQRPDVVHVHLSVLSPLGILAVRAAARAGVPVVVTVHSLWWWAASLYRLADRLTGWGDWPVHWSAVSDLAAEPLRRILGTRSEVETLPNGVDAAAWSVDPLPRDDAEIVVVSVMRLALRKRPQALMHIVREARAHLPQGVRLRVVLVGDGPQRRAVERLSRRYRLGDCVQLAGRMPRSAIRELYRRADLYLAPATLESFGIAALEARCAGLPVLARRRTGIADFVTHEVNGLLADDDPGLARGLVRLATDHRLRAELTRRNRTTVPEHGWTEVLTRYELAYKQAAETVPASARRPRQ